MAELAVALVIGFILGIGLGAIERLGLDDADSDSKVECRKACSPSAFKRINEDGNCVCNSEETIVVPPSKGEHKDDQ